MQIKKSLLEQIKDHLIESWELGDCAGWRFIPDDPEFGPSPNRLFMEETAILIKKVKKLLEEDSVTIWHGETNTNPQLAREVADIVKETMKDSPEMPPL
jgi:hypothetical protein